MKTIFISLILLGASLVSKSQQSYTQTIRGVVVDKHSQNPLPGASIVLLNSQPLKGAVCDSKGCFTLKDVEIGRQDIEIAFLGYNTIKMNNLSLTSGKELLLNIELEEKVITTQTVEVKARQRKDETINKMAVVSARSFSVEETERFAGSLGDPSRMAANYAGVMSISDSRNDIVIRGNSPAGLLWRLEEIEIPNPNHFGAAGTTGGPVSMLNNNLLTNSDFFTGAFPAEYGNAMSGVFDLKMRSGNNQQREYIGQIGLNGFELGAEGPFKTGKQSSYLANYRYSTLGVFNALGIDMGTGLAIPQYQDLTFKMDIHTKKAGKFTIIGLGGLSYIELHDSDKAKIDKDDDANYDYGGIDLDFGSDMGIIALSNLLFLNDKTRLKTMVSVLGTRQTTYIDSLKFENDGSIIQGSNYQFYASSINEVKYSISTVLRKKISAKNNFSTGLIFDYYDVDYSDSVKDSDCLSEYRSLLDINGELFLLRGFLQWQHRFSEKFTANAGVYAQHLNITGENVAEPRIGIKYLLPANQSLSFGTGMHSRTMARHNYFYQTWLDNNTSVQTNKAVQLMKSYQGVLGYDKLFSENLRLRIETYYQYLYDIPVVEEYPEYSMINIGSSFHDPVLDSLINTGTGKNYGVEFTFERFFKNSYYFLTTVSLFQSKYAGYSGTERNTAFNGNYVFNLLAGKEFRVKGKNGLTLDMKTVFAGGKPYIPIDLEKSEETNSTEYYYEDAFEQKFDEYFRMDIRIGYKLNGKKVSQEWALDLQNITNHKNIYSQQYNPRSKNIVSDNQTGFFPMVLYRIQF